MAALLAGDAGGQLVGIVARRPGDDLFAVARPRTTSTTAAAAEGGSRGWGSGAGAGAGGASVLNAWMIEYGAVKPPSLALTRQ